MQTVRLLETKVTANPELAVAVKANGATPTVCPLGFPNVIVWALPATKNVCVTGVAGAYVELPAWLAVIEHVPSVSSVTVAPDTVQTVKLLEAKVTANPELAVAVKANGAAPKVCPLGFPKVIVWALPATKNVWVTNVAGA